MRKRKFIAFLIIFTGLLFNSCEDERLKDTISPDYVPGEVLVGLVDTVTYQFAVDFFQSLDLEIIDTSLGHTLFTVADSNDLGYYKDLFSSDTTVQSIDKLATSPIDTLKVLITFNGVNSFEIDSLKVESLGLHLYYHSRHPRMAQLGVSIGQEYYWANKLEQYDFVRWAEPNYIVEIGFDD